MRRLLLLIVAVLLSTPLSGSGVHAGALNLGAVEKAKADKERRLEAKELELGRLASKLVGLVRSRTRGFIEPLLSVSELTSDQPACETAKRPVTFAASIGGLEVTPHWSPATFTATAAPNDVSLLLSALEARGVDKRRLYDLAGGRSTRASIRAAFLDILDKVRCGDHVIVHFSGEGGSVLSLLSLVGLDTDFDRPLTELAATVAGASLDDENARIVAASMVDDDLAMVVEAEDHQTLDIVTGRDLSNFLLALRNRGALAIAAIDTGDAVAASLTRRHRAAAERLDWSYTFGADPPTTTADALALARDHGDLIVFYATEKGEGAPELRLPAGAKDAKPYGLFTFFLASTLLESDDLTPRQFGEVLATRFRSSTTSMPVHPRIEATNPNVSLIAEAQVSRPDPIRIISPPSTRGALVLKRARANIEGVVDWPAKVLGVYVDNRPATLDSSGRFTATVALVTGVNKVGVVAVTADSRMHQKTVDVIFNGDEQALAGSGTNYAVIIANQNYPEATGMRSLETPLRDAEALQSLLAHRFGFRTDITTPTGELSLVLKDATKRQIETALFQLGKVATARDRVLIFYAGHGVFEAATSTAYWVPNDAEQGFEPSFLSASDISAAIQRIEAGSVILISDSCYSGALMRGGESEPQVIRQDRLNALLKLQSRRSRVVITSGNNEPVADNGGTGHSIFASALLDGLVQMEPDAFSARELFDAFILQRVVANADQEPQFRPLEKVGHEGGDFIFVRHGQNQSAAIP